MQNGLSLCIMGDRLSPANGKQDVFWGTLRNCPGCGRCLCYACHPHGPCLDRRESATPLLAPDTARPLEPPARL